MGKVLESYEKRIAKTRKTVAQQWFDEHPEEYADVKHLLNVMKKPVETVHRALRAAGCPIGHTSFRRWVEEELWESS